MRPARGDEKPDHGRFFTDEPAIREALLSPGIFISTRKKREAHGTKHLPLDVLTGIRTLSSRISSVYPSGASVQLTTHTTR